MITFFNKIGNTWIAKFICLALMLSMMAFWGLGGLSNGFSGNNHKAITIGSDVISIEQVNQIFERERTKISALTNMPLSQKKAIEIGLLDRAVQMAIAEKITQDIADEIGLAASDEAVRKYVERNPVFQDNLGHFDTRLFYAYLSQLKMNQTELSNQLKNELIQQHLSHAVSKVASTDNAVIQSVANNQKEKRKISAFLLKTEDIPTDTPDESTLKEYYDAYQEDFTVPEYRQIQLLAIEPSHFTNTEDDAYDKMYQAVQNLEDLLGAGTSLKEATQQLKLPSPYQLTIDINGLNRKGNISDKKLEKDPILQEIFTLTTGESTSIEASDNGFIVAEVEKIIPASFQKYEAVKEDVKALYKREQQKEKLPQLTQDILDKLINQKSWGHYQPIHEVVEQTQAQKVPMELLSSIYNQTAGYENAKSYSAPDGQWIVVINQIIPNTAIISDQEKASARQTYTQDVLSAMQQAYTTKFNVQIHEKVIQKFYSAYMKDQEE